MMNKDLSGLLYLLNANLLQLRDGRVGIFFEVLANLIEGRLEYFLNICARLCRGLEILHAVVVREVFSLILSHLSRPLITFVANNVEDFLRVEIFVIEVLDEIF